MNNYSFLTEGVNRLQPDDWATSPADFLILHCAGMAHAQKGEWSKAKAILDKIARKGSDPHYLPAGDTWLASVYNDYVETSQNELKLDAFLGAMGILLAQGQQFEEQMKSVDWTRFPSAPANAGFYQRELLKVIGSIAGLLADYSLTPEQRKRYLEQSEGYLKLCVETISGDPPAPWTSTISPTSIASRANTLRLTRRWMKRLPWL